MPPASSLSVVCAVLRSASGDRFLVAQRPAHKHLGGQWEFPGGKVEAGESPAAALRRELKEELGCEAIVGDDLGEFIHDYNSVRIAMRAFRCELAPGSPPPQPHEHAALAWETLERIQNLDLAAADRPIVDALRRAAG